MSAWPVKVARRSEFWPPGALGTWVGKHMRPENWVKGYFFRVGVGWASQITQFVKHNTRIYIRIFIWTASSEFGTYRLCEQRRFRRACASAQSRQNLRCSLIQAVSQEKPSDRKPDPWPLWMAGHAQLKFVMTECSKPQIRLAGLILCSY